MSTLRRLGELVLVGVEWVGAVSLLAARAASAVTSGRARRGELVEQLVMHGVRSLPITAFLSIFIGMILTWQFGDALADMGMATTLGYTTGVSLVRELVPTLIALTVGAMWAAGIAAELGSMTVGEQVEALQALGGDPIRRLVVPRVAAVTVSMPLLVVLGNACAFLGAAVVADLAYGVPTSFFVQTYIDVLTPWDYVAGIAKAAVFGALVGLLGCHHGLRTGRDTRAVGRSTTRAVIATAVLIIVADFYLDMALF